MGLEILKKLQELDIVIKVSSTGELKIQAPKGILTKELVQEIKAHKQKLIEVIGKKYQPIPKSEFQDNYPLTPSQKRLWFLSQFEGGDLAYNIPVALSLNGLLDVDMLHLAFLEVLNRHETLRTSFDKDKNGNVYQKVEPIQNLDFFIEIKDHSGQSNQLENIELIENEINFSFDLSKAPLLKAVLFKKAEDHHILFMNINHIVCDGVSMNILIKELFEIYKAKCNQETITLPELSIQYKDYAKWMQNDEQQRLLKEQESYWLEKFSGELPVLELPPYRTRPTIKTYNGKTINHRFSESFRTNALSFAQENEATLFMILMAGINGLFYRYTNNDDIILGTSVAGRDHKDLENQVGLFLNTLAIRTQFDPESNFSTLVTTQKEELLKAYSNQNYPFDELVNHVNTKRDPSRSPLFDILVELHHQDDKNTFSSEGENDLHISTINDLERPVSQLDITFSFIETTEDLSLSLEFNTDIYDEVTITKMLAHFETFVHNCIKNPKQSISQVSYITSPELLSITETFNSTETALPEHKNVIDIFESQVDAFPDKVAIQYEDVQLTYKEVDERANQLANYLKKEYGITKDTLVVLLMDRSELFLISIIGIWKSGGAYIPLEPDFPDERIKDVLEVSQSKLILTESEVLRESIKNYSDQQGIQILENHKQYQDQSKLRSIWEIGLNDLSYVIFTSGSTGKPKGAMIEHLGMLNHLYAKINTLDLDNNSIVAQNASQCFDISVWQLFCGLLMGGKTVIYSKDAVLNPSDFIQSVEYDNINILEVVPSYLSVLMDYEDTGEIKTSAYKNIRKMLVTGEALIATVSNRWVEKHSGIPLVNAYGPTEASDDITHYVIDKKHEHIIPIGNVLQNFKIYILDEKLNHCGIGVKGELCVSGIGVGRGYLNDPEKTNLVFIEDPFRPETRMYKTGDIARFRDDGVIEFFGRKDFQVKIRGYRIELGEIENVILQQKNIVKNAVVEVKEINAEKNIVAYIIPQEKLESTMLKQAILDKLPSYMVPSYFIEIEEIPLSRNGKVNRKALPEITDIKTESIAYIAPTNDIEQTLANIWQEILNIERVGITDNFFELGGHSLKAVQLTNKIKIVLGYDLNVKDIFLYPTIIQLQQRWTETIHNSIPKAPKQNAYPLSSHQQRLWILSQFDGGNIAYNIPMAFWLEGTWEISLLEKSFKELIKKHESLRTIFKEGENNQTQQYILSPKDIDFSIDYAEINATESPIAINHTIKQHSRENFDLTKGPLFKVKMIRFSEEKHILIFNIHHIIADGWSIEVIFKETLATYTNLKEGKYLEQPQLEVQYKDYAVWLQSEDVQELITAQESYWLDKFSVPVPILELPSFKQRPLVKTFNGNTFSYQFSSEITKKLKTLSDKNQATLFMTLMAGIKGLFYRYTNVSDIVIGTPIAGRNHPDLENQIGLFLNTLAIRSEINGTYNFNQWLAIEKQELLDAYSNQEYPFDTLVDKLNLKRDTSRSALFDVMVELHNYQNMFTKNDTTLGDLKISEVEDPNRGVSQFDMTFSFVELESNLELFLEYNQDIYDQNIIQKLVEHLDNFLTSIVANPNQSIDAIDYVSATEKEIIFDQFKGEIRELPEQQTIVDVIESRVQEAPDAIAVTYENQNITYKEFNAKANQIAHCLDTQYKIEEDDLVCVLMDRSEWFMISVFAIWKSGGAYIPIDPDYPTERIKEIVGSSKSKLVFAAHEISSELAIYFEENQIQILNPLGDFSRYKTQNLQKKISVHSLSYVIYTSGSTGAPKGAMVEHLGMLNHLYAKINTLKLTKDSIVAQNASQCFDISIWQFFSALMTSGQTVIYSKQSILNPPAFINKVYKDFVTILEVVPSYLAVLLDYEDMKEIQSNVYDHLNYLMVTGETLITAIANQWVSRHAKIPIVNAYGPTEASDDITQYEFNTLHSGTIPIGRTLQNLNIYILDDRNKLCGIGVKGELCVSGIGVGRGYLYNPEKTAPVFIEDPFRPGIRMYKTGDIARYRYDGVLEFFGRKDFQVKVRGHRIELGEIENVLLKQSELVKNAVVEVKEIQQQKTIVAYVVPNGNLDNVKIKKALENTLPYYMVPSYYIDMDKIPLTANGKVDRKRLPEVEGMVIEDKEIIAPANDIEEALVLIWKDILKTETISTEDNFFELGGNSLSVGVLINKIKSHFETNISFSKFYLSPTIKKTADLISNKEAITPLDILVKLKEGDESEPLFFIHPIGGNVSSYEFLVQNLEIPNAVYGIQSRGLFTDQEPLTSIEAMASFYIEAIKSIQNKGSYSIAGWSFGGLIAYEIANKLRQKGDEIKHLFLIDSHIPSLSGKSYIHASDKDIVSALLLEQGENKDTVLSELSRMPEEEHLDFLWSKVLQTHRNLTPDEREIVRRFMQVFRANETAFYTYQPKVSELPKIHLYRATKDIDNSPYKENIIHQWSNLISEGIIEVAIEGNHYSLVNKKESGIISKSIQTAIESSFSYEYSCLLYTSDAADD